MLYRYIVAVMVCWVSHAGILTAQEDSLLTSLKNRLKTPLHDTEKVKVLSELSETAADGEWEPYTMQCLELIEKNLKQVKSPEQKRFYEHYLAIILSNGGLIYKNKGDLATAIRYYRRSYDLSKQLGFKENMSAVLTNLGRAYYYQGHVIEALDTYEEVLKLYTAAGNKSAEAFSINLIAELYRDQEEYGKALEYYQRSLKINESIQDEAGIIYSLNGIGAVYFLQNDRSKAMTYYTAVLKRFDGKPDSQPKAAVLNDLGHLYVEEGASRKAVLYLQQSAAILEREGYRQYLSVALRNLGVAYEQMHRDDSAFVCFTKSLQLAMELGYPDAISKASSGLYHIYKRRGESAKALDMYELSVKMHDSIYNSNTRKASIRSQFRYEYEKKAVADSIRTAEEKKVAALKLKQEQTQNFLLILVLLLVLLIGFIWLQRIRHRQRLKEARLRQKIASDLHDEVGSALSSISMYAGVARMQNQDTGGNAIVEKIELTSRETIENMSDIVWSIQPKNDDFKHVLEKMKHFGSGLLAAAGTELHMEYDEDVLKLQLDIEQRKNSYLIFKEALNNVAKYAGATEARVQIGRQGKTWWMTITDNGRGFDPSTKSLGNGLHNMKHRAAEMGAEINIQSAPGQGTRIRLEFRST